MHHTQTAQASRSYPPVTYILVPYPSLAHVRRFVSGWVYAAAVATVMFVDETTGGGRTGQWGMEVAEERVPLRELIRRRISG